MSTWQEQDFLIPSDHPTAAGHFPSNPIIPGALLLDAVVAAAAPGQPCTIRSAKFLIPVTPGTKLQLRWQEAGKFECRTHDDALVMSGMLAVSS
jgi:3-hydroxyacyl-[acyl-carrier-protein] dehydratase